MMKTEQHIYVGSIFISLVQWTLAALHIVCVQLHQTKKKKLD